MGSPMTALLDLGPQTISCARVVGRSVQTSRLKKATTSGH
ncbi:TPA: hypothetical protein N0F65_011515 [Lagenidium giganteum]|uniref:Uncharacterized protein n=1 Tax=Lagenidium giganteum TaxID=4803 RepID=A0AAV2Z815_9STRA|nr:TPA: hypothetical protein N0F65_011515 [Lagenidium giganteum]